MSQMEIAAKDTPNAAALAGPLRVANGVVWSRKPPYQQFVEAGFADVRKLRPRRDPGFTCCQAPDLLNEVSLLDERIDIVFAGEAPLPALARTFGDWPTDKTRSGLWPSDQAGVAARLLFWPGPATITAAR